MNAARNHNDIAHIVLNVCLIKTFKLHFDYHGPQSGSIYFVKYLPISI